MTAGTGSLRLDLITGNTGIVFAAAGNVPVTAGYSGGTAQVVDAVAPTLTGVGVSATTTTATTLAATSSEAGTGYWSVFARGATSPTAAQVKNAAGSPVASGNAVMLAATSRTFNVTGLSPDTNYDLYFVANDAAGNLVAAPVLVQFATPALGACGSANGIASGFAPPIATLCAKGTPSAVSAGTGWTWSCTAATVSTCAAPYATTSTGTGVGHLGVTASGGIAAWTVQSASFVSVASTGTPGPSGYNFPHGLVSFTLSGGTSASTATLEITFPAALPAGAVWWKYGASPDGYNCSGSGCAAPHWYRYPAVISVNKVTLTLTDGGAGDEVQGADGFIVDPGGPALPIETTSIPALSEWGLILLSCLMALFGLGQTMRRQHNA